MFNLQENYFSTHCHVILSLIVGIQKLRLRRPVLLTEYGSGPLQPEGCEETQQFRLLPCRSLIGPLRSMAQTNFTITLKDYTEEKRESLCASCLPSISSLYHFSFFFTLFYLISFHLQITISSGGL